MVLVVLLLGCASPSFDASGLAELACASTVETATWDTLVDGVSLGEHRDAVLGRQSFVNQKEGEFFDEIALVLRESGESPVLLSWQGEDCPDVGFRLPLEGSWDIAGTAPSECACQLDQTGYLGCAGAILEDEETERRLREYGAEGAGLFINPPLLLDWDSRAGTASAEIWLEFQVSESWIVETVVETVIPMHDLVHQPQE